jgi:hypothetical protein
MTHWYQKFGLETPPRCEGGCNNTPQYFEQKAYDVDFWCEECLYDEFIESSEPGTDFYEWIEDAGFEMA